MTQEKAFEYLVAFAAVIAAMIVQVAMFFWGDANLTALIIGETALAGCLVYMGIKYRKDSKNVLDNSESAGL